MAPRIPSFPREGRVLRRAVLLRRYENHAAALVERELTKATEKLVALIERQPPSDVSQARQAARLESLAAKADAVLVQAYTEINVVVRRELRGLAKAGGDASAAEIKALLGEVDIVVDALKLPTRDQLWSIVTTDPVQGAVMRDWWGQQSRKARDAFRREIRLGLTQREQTPQLIRRIRGRAVGRGRYTGGTMPTTTREATTLVRTAVNDVYNRAASRTIDLNRDITLGSEFVATLDERTCPRCGRLDGKVWKHDDGDRVQPPVHFNCRCICIPVLNYRAVGAKNPRTTPRERYFDWFARQPAGVQDAIIGPRRGARIRRGDGTFSDHLKRDGTLIPLATLEAG